MVPLNCEHSGIVSSQPSMFEAMGNRVACILAATSLLLQAAVAVNIERALSLPPLVPRTWNGQSYGCKCYLGDECWPSAQKWNTLNATVNGNLVVHVPPEAACHNTFDGPLGTVSTYDAEKCAEVTANYPREQWM